MKATEKTILTALVNIACVGYPGKCLTHFTKSERGRVLDTLYNRGLIDDHARPTKAAKAVIIENMHLCQY